MVTLLIRFSILNEQKLADRLIISPFWGMWGINVFFLAVDVILTLHVSSSIRITNLFRSDE
jgi:lipopolysaccharide export system permease protein